MAVNREHWGKNSREQGTLAKTQPGTGNIVSPPHFRVPLLHYPTKKSMLPSSGYENKVGCFPCLFKEKGTKITQISMIWWIDVRLSISAPRRKGDVWIELNEVFYFSARLTDQSLFTLHHVRPIILHGERWCSDDITTHAFQPIIRSVGQIARPFDCVLLQPSQPITAHTYERTSCWLVSC